MTPEQAAVKQYEDICNFHEKFKLPPYNSFDDMPKSLVQFREKFIVEEATETINALGRRDKPEALDGLIDLSYVAMGTYYLAGNSQRRIPLHVPSKLGIFGICKLADGVTLSSDTHAEFLLDIVFTCRYEALALGFFFDTGWDRVQVANMSKVRAKVDTVGKRGSTWDVVKPKGWEAPRMDDLV